MALTISRTRMLAVAALLAVIATVLAVAPITPAGAVGNCTVSDNGDGTLTLNWDAAGDVRWAVRTGPANASIFLETVTDTPTTTVSAGNVYSIRYVQQNNVEVDCTLGGGQGQGPCSAVENADGTVTVTWDLSAERPNGVDQIAIRRYRTTAADATFQDFSTGAVGTFVDADVPDDDFLLGYVIRAFGPRADFDCGTARAGLGGGGGTPAPAPAPGTPSCSAVLGANGAVTVTWADDGASRYAIRRGVNGGNIVFIAAGENFTFIDNAPPPGTVAYEVRSVIGGVNVDTSCGTVGGGELQPSGCTAVFNDDGSVTVTRNNDGALTWVVRRSLNGAEEVFIGDGSGLVFTDNNPPAGDLIYYVRARFVGGIVEDIRCNSVGGGAPIPPPPPPAPDPVNLSEGQPAAQSSTFRDSSRWAASEAVDGDTRGANSQRSISHTATESQPWWEVNLGSASTLSEIQIWNRTDNCCVFRLSNFSVFVSDSPMTGRSFAQLRNDNSVTEFHIDGTAGRPTVIDATGVTGQYVRVQLEGTESLQMAEVVVLGNQ